MRFEFVTGNRVGAAGYMKGAAVARRGLVPNLESYGAMGMAPLQVALPAPVRDWLAAEDGVIGAAW